MVSQNTVKSHCITTTKIHTKTSPYDYLGM